MRLAGGKVKAGKAQIGRDGGSGCPAAHRMDKPTNL